MFFSQFIIKLMLMFLINWVYSIVCILLCIGIWFYVGKTAPGINPGIAGEFSLVAFVKTFVAKLSG